MTTGAHKIRWSDSEGDVMKYFILLKAANSAKRNYMELFYCFVIALTIILLLGIPFDKNIMMSCLLLLGGIFIMRYQPKY